MLSRLPLLLGLIPLAVLAAPSASADSPAAYVWKNVTITGGGFVTGIVAHPAELDLVYARTDVGGAYRLNPVTRRWQSITDWIGGDNWSLTGIESLALDPTDPDRVYLAAGSYTNNWSGNGFILRSTDRGASWERTPVPFKFGGNEPGRSNGNRLAVDPAAPAVLFLGTRHDGLWSSPDHGATWSRVASFPLPGDTLNGGVTGIVFIPRHGNSDTHGSPASVAPEPSMIYVAASSPSAAIWRSMDAGASWERVARQPAGLRPHFMKTGADGLVYITYGNDAGPNNVIDGAVWKHDPATGAWTDITPLKPSKGDRFGYAGLALDARHPGTLLVSTICRWSRQDELFRSIDGGTTWRAVSPKATFDDAGVAFLRWGRPTADVGHWIGALEIDPFNPDRALYGTGMTIWGTDNLTAADREEPTRWTVRAQGVEETVITALVSPPAGAPLLSTMWDIDGFRHETLDQSPASGFFQPARGKDTGIDAAWLRPGIVARVYHGGGAWSRDNGCTWTLFSSTPADTRGDGTITVSAKGGSFVWTPEKSGSWFTRDRGTTWEKSAGLPASLRPVADRRKEGCFYACDPGDGLVYSSDDSGATFQVVGHVEAHGGQLRAAPDQAGHLWLVSREGLQRSTDGGKTFATVSTAATGEQLGFGRRAPGVAFPTLFLAGKVDGQKGVFRSTDDGKTWLRLNPENLQFNSISALVGDPRVFGRVYIGTRGRGIFYGEPKAANQP